ncbi:MAG: cytochrome c3 family protein [Gallionella sp.]
MKVSSASLIGFVIVVIGVLMSSAHAGDPSTPFDRFTNIGSIVNTRHNMTQSSAPLIVSVMNGARNNYGEVCVYCHTPHGANNTIAAPLWNRTIKVTNYQTYDELGTTSLTQAVTSTPGSASLTCLSCHDGQTAIDSIINMPGSGMGLLSQQTTQNTAFLNSWPPGGGGPTQHMGLNSTNNVLGDGTGNRGCLVCHSTTGILADFGPDFAIFNLGTDLRNDHPIGITFPAPPGSPLPDWKTPLGVKGGSNYFDDNNNGRMEKAEIRTYDGKVECASCHDPHGVPSAGTGTVFNKTFLRKQNTNGSAVCLSCHTK